MKNKEAKKVFITDGAACMKKRKKEEKSKKLKYSFFPTDGAACSAEASTTLVDTTHIISLGKKMMKIMMILIEMVMVMMMMMMIEMVMILRGCPPTCHVPNHSDQMSLPHPHTHHSHTQMENVMIRVMSLLIDLWDQNLCNLNPKSIKICRKRRLPCKFVAWATDKQQRKARPHLSCPVV